ncbi:hypothetical protein DXG01_001558 [Tephrocybe rancida]|nr:hypothetical protein DXG01_001558 [Tephrocybe rancida]
MAKKTTAKAPSASQKKKTSSLSDNTTAPLSIAGLTALGDTARQTYAQPKTTKKAYAGYMERGRKFIAQLCAERRVLAVEDDIDTDVLETSLTGIPNKHSVIALKLFLSKKCFDEDLSKETAGGIQGAYTNFYDLLGDGRYSGPYHLDEDSGKVTGNPARAPSFRQLIQAANAKSKATRTRGHSHAMSIEDLHKVLNWSESIVSEEELDAAIESPPEDRARRTLILRHAKIRALFRFGFVIWTRNFELTGVRWENIERSLGANFPYRDIFNITLPRRKGDQNKSDKKGHDGPLIGSLFTIDRPFKVYSPKPETNIRETDLFTPLDKYMRLVIAILGRDPQPDDVLFFAVSASGTIHLDKEMTREAVQELINDATKSAGLAKTYTTHCFRRGGAKYRFIYAPISMRWRLDQVRWWGGWAQGESLDTLMKYLLDTVESMEGSYDDSLNPDAPNEPRGQLGEGSVHDTVTLRDFTALHQSIIRVLQQKTPVAGDQDLLSGPPLVRHPNEALKDWPLEWTTHKSVAVLYHGREAFWEEFQKCGGTEDSFLAAHPEANDITWTELLDKIATLNGAQPRVSKNGRPEERAARRLLEKAHKAN